MKKKSTVKKPKTRAAKIAEAKALFEKLFPDDTMIDLRKVYTGKRKLSARWGTIFDDHEEMGLVEKDLCHFPETWLTQKGYLRITDEDLSSSTLEGNDNYYIFNGRNVVTLLNKLRAELGPNPEKALVMSTPDGYAVVELKDTTDRTLDFCVELLRESVEDAEDRERLQQEREAHHEQQVKLMKLVTKMGIEKAIATLEKK